MVWREQQVSVVDCSSMPTDCASHPASAVAEWPHRRRPRDERNGARRGGRWEALCAALLQVDRLTPPQHESERHADGYMLLATERVHTCTDGCEVSDSTRRMRTKNALPTIPMRPVDFPLLSPSRCPSPATALLLLSNRRSPTGVIVAVAWCVHHRGVRVCMAS